ncbi:hypothetical protein AI2983V1_2665 [Enterobacter cloacae]|nr:hypothetical protein AI2983V1_2665 [Enterobacter cloacae]CAH5649302.1 hypothetical protein AI2983V1_2665 [Enterobacter cloacae]
MSIITTERLTTILSETQAVISECNSRGVHGSVEVNARLFENVLMELLRHRAAMLQGAEPSKMSGIMPDYEGGTLTQRELFRAGWEAHHRAMLQSGAPVQFGWSKGHFGYNALFNAISKAVSIQGSALSISVSAFEDAMLAAAPQQEVK